MILDALLATAPKSGAVLGGIGAATADGVRLKLQKIDADVTMHGVLTARVAGVELVSARCLRIDDLNRDRRVAGDDTERIQRAS